eukprot:3034262-Prymnesium_polylepis.2
MTAGAPALSLPRSMICVWRWEAELICGCSGAAVAAAEAAMAGWDSSMICWRPSSYGWVANGTPAALPRQWLDGVAT